MHDFFLSLFLPAFFQLSFLLLILLSCKTRLLLWGHLQYKIHNNDATRRAGSAISLKANVRANVRRGPNTMKICGRVWGLFELPQLWILQQLKIKRKLQPQPLQTRILQKNVFYLILTSLESHSPCRSKAISIEAISCKIQVLQNVQT